MKLFNTNSNNSSGHEKDNLAMNFLDQEINKLQGQTGDLFKANMRNIGFKSAGLSRATLPVLKAVLGRIRAAAITDAEKDKEGQEQFKEPLRREIEKLQLEIGKIDKKIARSKTMKETAVETTIPHLKEEIKNLEKRKGEIELEIAAQKDEVKKNPFSKGMLWSLFILGTVYLYMFYVTASFSALFRSVESAMESAKVTITGNASIDQLINTIFVPEAYTTFNFHWLLPIAFFLIGAVLHFAFDTRGWKKFIAIPMAFLMVLGADALLAFLMEEKAHLVGSYTGISESPNFYFFEHALNQPNFYFILTLGSVSVICWSIIVHRLQNMFSDEPALREIRASKLSANRMIKKLIGKIKKQETLIKNLEGEVETLEIESKNVNDQISFLERRIDRVTYSPSRLASNILAFYQGWMQYVSALQDSQFTLRTEECFKKCISDMDLELPGYMTEQPSAMLNEAV